MKRSLSVFIWILIGALAASGGLGYFLHQANQDRQHLLNLAHAAEQRAQEAQTANLHLTNEANTKLQDASKEVQRTKEELEIYKQHQADYAAATPLRRPADRTLRSWTPAISIPLGLSLLVPPLSSADTNSAQLILSTTSSRQVARWMTIAPYQANEEQTWLQSTTNTQPIRYTTNGQTLVGVKGVNIYTSLPQYIFRLQTLTTSTHLLWIQPNAAVNDQRILDTLSTLSVNS